MLEFETALVKLPGKMAWTVFYVPESFTDTKNRVNVLATVDGAEFRCTMLPSNNGHYIVYNRAMRECGGKKIGEAVHVMLEMDNQPRELIIPPDVEAALNDNKAAAEKFAALPYYIRREEIVKIESAKMQQTREKRIQALVDKMLK